MGELSEPDDGKKVAPVASISEARQKRGEADHARGDAFAFEIHEFEDESIGVLDDQGIGYVTFVTHDLKGICMTPEDAEKLGVALIQAAFAARAE